MKMKIKMAVFNLCMGTNEGNPDTVVSFSLQILAKFKTSIYYKLRQKLFHPEILKINGSMNNELTNWINMMGRGWPWISANQNHNGTFKFIWYTD